MIFSFAGTAIASLTTIGTATYGGNEYNLIWDDDNNGKSLVWLDYANGGTKWTDQNAWAAGLDGDLSVNLNGYTIAWQEDTWRLSCGNRTTEGYDLPNSEMAHLFYEELGNNSGTFETGPFNNIASGIYWTGTDYPWFDPWAWFFVWGEAWGSYSSSGLQSYEMENAEYMGLAIREGAVSPVPVPAAVWLLGSGLLGLTGLRRRRNSRSV
jgi:hypothetical protein